MALLFFAQAGSAQANGNAILDLESTDKGLMLPRLNDTTSVSNPTSGLMIYNNNTSSPAFHNGDNWNTVATAVSLPMPPVSIGDSITYTLDGPGNYFVNGTYDVLAFSTGGSSSARAGFPPPTTISVQDISFTKLRDINSIPFLQNLASNLILPNTS